MKRKIIFIVAALAVCAGGLGVWRLNEQRVKALKIESEVLRNLSEEQVVMVLQNQQLVEPGKTFSVVQSEETRKVFLKGLREYLALAAAARYEGLTDDPSIRRILAYRRESILFSLYQNKLDNDIGRFFEVPKDQVDSFLADPANNSDFEADMRAIREIQRRAAVSTGNPLSAPSAAEGEAKVRNREAWAKTKIISAMAQGDAAFIDQPAVQLRLKIAEAGVLATNFLNKYWAAKVRPTDGEINDYLALHPEYDVSVKRGIAQKVLDRVKAGEDFDALAKEFSEDRTTKSKGGLYENVEPGFLWNEVQAAALSLENGKTAPELIETKDGFHIVRLVSKIIRKGADGGNVPVISVRHILIQRRFEEPGSPKPEIPPPFLTPREIAESAIRILKRQALVDQIVAAQPISLPEDFPYEITDELRNGGFRIEKRIDSNTEADEVSK